MSSRRRGRINLSRSDPVQQAQLARSCIQSIDMPVLRPHGDQITGPPQCRNFFRPVTITLLFLRVYLYNTTESRAYTPAGRLGRGEEARGSRRDIRRMERRNARTKMGAASPGSIRWKRTRGTAWLRDHPRNVVPKVLASRLRQRPPEPCSRRVQPAGSRGALRRSRSGFRSGVRESKAQSPDHLSHRWAMCPCWVEPFGEQSSIRPVRSLGGCPESKARSIAAGPGFVGRESSRFLWRKLWKKPETDSIMTRTGGRMRGPGRAIRSSQRKSLAMARRP